MPSDATGSCCVEFFRDCEVAAGSETESLKSVADGTAAVPPPPLLVCCVISAADLDSVSEIEGQAAEENTAATAATS